MSLSKAKKLWFSSDSGFQPVLDEHLWDNSLHFCAICISYKDRSQSLGHWAEGLLCGCFFNNFLEDLLKAIKVAVLLLSEFEFIKKKVSSSSAWSKVHSHAHSVSALHGALFVSALAIAAAGGSMISGCPSIHLILVNVISGECLGGISETNWLDLGALRSKCCCVGSSLYGNY